MGYADSAEAHSLQATGAERAAAGVPRDEPVRGSQASTSAEQQARIHELRRRLPKGIHHRVKALVDSSAVSACPVMQRRAARKVGAFTMDEVAQHHFVDDAWVVIDGEVYDVTDHLVNHYGWQPTSDATTPLSILAHSGMDCTEEFHHIHRNKYPLAYKQLPAFHIGKLVPGCSESSVASEQHTAGAEAGLDGPTA